jgi:hypothetical protein
MIDKIFEKLAIILFIIMAISLNPTLGKREQKKEVKLKTDSDFLTAAANGEADKVVQLIQEEGASIVAKNNYGVR